MMDSRTVRTRGLALLAALLISTTPRTAAGAPKSPQGHLLIIGGGERGPEIMSRFAQLAGGPSARVVAFTMASSVEDAGASIEKELRGLGLGEVRALPLTRAEADGDAALAALEGVTAVYFGGGNQSRLTAALGGSRVEARLHELYERGAVLAGTSAGAAVMTRVMITGDERRPLSKDEAFQTIEAENVITARGFGFLEGAIIDQHFVRRRRGNRLLSAVIENPGLLGIGIDEETAIWVKPGRTFEVLGAGPVLVYDAGQGKLGSKSAAPGLSASGLVLHVLRRGSTYDLAMRKVIRLGP
jgi:cyanophycinase